MGFFEEHITAKDYAHANNLNPTTVRQQCARGTMPGAVKLGHNWYIPKDAVATDNRITSGKYVGVPRKRNKPAPKAPVEE